MITPSSFSISSLLAADTSKWHEGRNHAQASSVELSDHTRHPQTTDKSYGLYVRRLAEAVAILRAQAT